MKTVNVKNLSDAYLNGVLTFDGVCSLIGNYTKHVGNDFGWWQNVMINLYKGKRLEKSLEMIRDLKKNRFLF